MKLIYLNVKGYHNYKDDEFEVDFRLSKRVRNEIIIDELDEIQEHLYLGNSYPFIGKNSSGKTTTFNLLNNVLRVMFGEEKISNLFGGIDSLVEVKVDFYYLLKTIEGYRIIRNKSLIGGNSLGQSYLISEKIYERKLIKADRNSSLLNFDEKDLKYDSAASNFHNESFMYNKRYIDNHQIHTIYHVTNEDKFDLTNNSFTTYFKSVLNENTVNQFEQILKLLDESIEYVKWTGDINSLHVKFKRWNGYNTTLENLSTILSDGTKRGARLLFTSYLILKEGGVVIVDEIELHLHKALAIELISLFQSERINKSNATLIFSTHYTELLDIFSRNDIIHVVKNESGIVNYRLSDVITRNDTKLSKAYLETLIDSSPSYDNKINMRKSFEL